MRGKNKRLRSAKDLKVYQKAYALAMEIFNTSKRWPAEEKFSLTDQIRRSSRSVCSNLREAWAKRRYEAHFISKLTDADGENSETLTWTLLRTVSTSAKQSIVTLLKNVKLLVRCSVQ